ncbi:MAG: hypothetical protein A4E73_01064 [Syntrophaceae bacterium PtaU1.Bin231]|nr:MAG: hypothetical protein A4E73_01064 [Syntrophaceae bacterium PtaU1.Bin231]
MLISIPKGARNMPAMPISISQVNLGIARTSASIASISRVPITCAMEPTQRKSRHLATAWKMMRSTAAQSAS